MSGHRAEDVDFETDEQQRWRNCLSGVESSDAVIIRKSWQYIIDDVDELSVQVLAEHPHLYHVSAEDLRQSILLKLQDPAIRLKIFQSTTPHGYLAAMMRNLAIDLLRRSRVERKVFREFLWERLRRRKSSVPDEKVQKLEEQLAKLSGDDRDLVEMRYGQNLSIQEIADALGLSYSATAARLCRLKSKLREDMGG